MKILGIAIVGRSKLSVCKTISFLYRFGHNSYRKEGIMVKILNKSRLKKITAAAAACAILASNAVYSNMNIIKVSAATGEYKTWKQSDSRWAGTYIGRSGETMSQSGCAITSLATLVVHAGYEDESNFNPGTFCNFLSSNGGVDGSGNIYWGAVSLLVPDFTFAGTQYLYGSSESEKASEIKSYLDQGYYVISDVKYSGHWVAIDTVVDDTVYSFDPASYTTNNLFDQYDYKGATRLKLFKSKGTSSSPSKPAEDQNSSKTYSVGKYVTTSKLNLRESPSTTANIKDVLDINKKVEVTEVSKNWGKVSYSGKTGWICLDYTAVIDSSEPEVTYKTGTYKTKNVINYRESADISSKTFGLIDKNTTLGITEISGQWGKTVYNGKTSWVCLEYADFVSDEIVTQPAVTETAPPVTTTQPPVTTVPQPETTTTQPPVSSEPPATTTTSATTTQTQKQTVQETQPTSAVQTTVQSSSQTQQPVTTTQAPVTTTPAVQTTPAVTTTQAATTTESFDPSEVILGDVNGDSRVDIIDVLKLAKLLNDDDCTIDSRTMAAADCNNDSAITVRDLVALKFMLM